jgi:hypothetical protein
MVEQIAIREREPEPADADPYRTPTTDAAPAVTRRRTGRIVLRVVEWTLGLPMVLLGLMQCGVATIFFALSFATDVGIPRSLAALLFLNGLMLVVPGAMLCLGKSWAAWFVLVFGLASLCLGLVATNPVFLVFGALLTGLAIAILVLAAVFPRGRD